MNPRFLYGSKPLRFDYTQCPVCGSRLNEHSKDYISEGTLCEAVEECPNKCWYYHYAYGNSEMHVTIRRQYHVSFYANWHDDPQECRDRDEALDIVIAAAQACILEDYWANFPALEAAVIRRFGDGSRWCRE